MNEADASVERRGFARKASRPTLDKLIHQIRMSRGHWSFFLFFCVSGPARRRGIPIAGHRPRPDRRFVVGQPETLMMPPGGGEVGFAVEFTRQTVVLQLAARAVAPGRGDLVDSRLIAAAGRA